MLWVVKECRVVRQEWYETETTKTGWDSHGWTFDDGCVMGNDWTIIDYVQSDKFGNPFLAIAEREVNINI